MQSVFPSMGALTCRQSVGSMGANLKAAFPRMLTKRISQSKDRLLLSMYTSAPCKKPGNGGIFAVFPLQLNENKGGIARVAPVRRKSQRLRTGFVVRSKSVAVQVDDLEFLFYFHVL